MAVKMAWTTHAPNAAATWTAIAAPLSGRWRRRRSTSLTMSGVIAAHGYQLAPTMSSTRHGSAAAPLPRRDSTVSGTPNATGMLQASSSTGTGQRGAGTSAEAVVAMRYTDVSARWDASGDRSKHQIRRPQHG